MSLAQSYRKFTVYDVWGVEERGGLRGQAGGRAQGQGEYYRRLQTGLYNV